MYFFLFFLLLIVLCLGLFFWRRHRAMKKIRCMTCCEKQRLLDTILEPFGYFYESKQDLVSTRNDAWQRQAGYTALFDKAALSFHMVFDALPVYFDYQGRTWLIEIWKGQYGINAGAEVGVYYADRLLEPEEYTTARFQAAADNDRLPVTFSLFRKETLLATMSGNTWWLTAFMVGMYIDPAQLSMEITIRFPSLEMQRRFLEALSRLHQENKTLRYACCCQGLGVHICYSCGCPASPICPERITRLRRLRIRWTQLCNRFFCRLYCRITRPFTCTLDRILYLYELLPFILRRILRRLKGVIRT